MSLRISGWRCSSCGAALFDLVTVPNGWIEVKCRKCREVNHLGRQRDNVLIVDVRCHPVTETPNHKIAEASSDWDGIIETFCDRCDERITVNGKRPQSPAPQRPAA